MMDACLDHWEGGCKSWRGGEHLHPLHAPALLQDFLKNIYLLIWLLQVLVATRGIFVAACVIFLATCRIF